MRDLHVKLLALALAGLGALTTWYKVERLGLPLSPAEDVPVWTVEARVGFRALGSSAKASLVLPEAPPGFVIIDENFISSSFGLTLEKEGAHRVARWAVRRASGQQALYYRVSLHPEASTNRERNGPKPRYPDKPDYPEAEGAAIEALLEDVREDSADIESFTRELLQRFHDDDTDENVRLLRKESATLADRAHTLVDILAGARIPSRIVWGLSLREGSGIGHLEPLLEVHDEKRWIPFDLATGRVGFPEDFLVWRMDVPEILDVVRGSKPEVEFSATRRVSDFVAVAEKRARQLGSSLMDFSLFSLPVGVQQTYQVLLTIPVGIALIVVLRNVVGLSTFGTFMPVLIALAFRETNLVLGIGLLVMIVSIGLLLRFYLENLKLLLVPRLASVVIIVIGIMVAISILSHRLGLEQGLSVSLFPMVILAMTIERMSIVWEETGARTAMQQLAASVACSAMVYLVMANGWIQYLVFAFPELLLVLLAGTLMLGRYKGYRLLELWRFREAILERDQG